MADLPVALPEFGIGETAAAEMIRSLALDGAARLCAPDALAHMDPAAAIVASSLAADVARTNQNLLHPETSPFASEAERLVLGWLTSAFGMRWGQTCSGSSVANLTALWAARESGARCVVASAEAHVSVPKAAHILGMDYHEVTTDHRGRLVRLKTPSLARAALVLTAGTTSRGAIDNLAQAEARWLHVDAAWAGPLQFTRFANLLEGIAVADSIAISAHKWLFQAKGAAFALFSDHSVAERITFRSSYLARPNVGVEGTRGAVAIPLLATLLAWGRQGLANRIERCMDLGCALADRLENDPRTQLLQRPETGVLNWYPNDADVARVLEALTGTSSSVVIGATRWIRQVCANPDADLERVWSRIDQALG